MSKKDLKHSEYNGIDLNGADFSGRDLKEGDFRKSNLRNAKFKGADLSGADFSGSDLSGANLDEVEALGAIFVKARLVDVRAQRATLSYSDFTESNLAGADLSGAMFEASICRKADFSSANLKGCVFSEVEFQESILRNTDLAEARISHCDFTGADFSSASFINAHILDMKLDGATFLRTQMPDGKIYPPEEETKVGSAFVKVLEEELTRLIGDIRSAKSLYMAKPDDSSLKGLQGAWDALFIHKIFALLSNTVRAEILTEAGYDFLECYKKSGASSDLVRVKDLWRAVVLDTGLEPAQRMKGLLNLEESLLDLYQQTHEIQDLSEAVDWQLLTLDEAGLDAANQVEVLYVLGNRLRWIYKDVNDIRIINYAVQCHRKAIEMANPDLPTLPDLLDTLGIDLKIRYEVINDAADLEQAIIAWEQAIELTATRPNISQSYLADYILNLGAGYCLNFARTRMVNDIDKAIGNFKTALEVAPDGWALTNNAWDQLANLLDERYKKLHNDSDLDQVINLRRLILSNPNLTASNHLEQQNLLATDLGVRFEAREKFEDLDEAITCLRQALALSPDDIQTQAELNARLGAYLLKRTRFQNQKSEKAADLDAAIVALHESVTLVNPDYILLPRWLHNLALALRDRFVARGDQSDHIAAIDAWRRALQLSTNDLWDLAWMIIGMIETAPTELVEMKLNDIPGVSELVQKFDDVLAEAIREGDKNLILDLQIGLAVLLLEFRFRIGDHKEPIEDAINLLEEALRTTGVALTVQLGSVHDMLCRAYNKRTHGLIAQNIEDSIRHGIAALEYISRTESPLYWAGSNNNLAGAYLGRIHGERAENIELAIYHIHESLQVRTMESYPVQWAMLQNSLGIAYLDRVRDNRKYNVEKAIKHLNNALMIRGSKDFPEKWADTQSNLATAYMERSVGDPSNNIEKAITHNLNALEVRTRETFPKDWAEIMVNLGSAYISRMEGVLVENLYKADECFQCVLEVLQPDTAPRLWGAVHHNAAEVMLKLNNNKDEQTIKCIIEHYRQALNTFTLVALPADHLRTQLRLGEFLFELQRWELTHDAFQAAIKASDILYAQAFTEVGRRSEVAQVGNLHIMEAWCLLHLSKPSYALEQLEKGRARLLSESLNLNGIDMTLLPADQQKALHNVRKSIQALEAEMRLPVDTPARRNDRTLAKTLEKARARLNRLITKIHKAHPNVIPKGLALADILAFVPGNAALVAPLITSQGSAVFVVPAGIQSVSADQVLWLKNFKEADLQELLIGSAEKTKLGGWLNSYFNASTYPEAWFDTIEASTRTLWDSLIGPIADRLEILGIQHVLLMPQGRLSLFPLHAAWHEIKGVRHYFLDEYTVTFIPNVFAQKTSQERMLTKRELELTLFAVINPTEDLPFTSAEGSQVARLFQEDKSTLLYGKKATLDEVKQGIASYFHFACHGYYDWQDPMQSALILANREHFTLSQIIGQFNLERTRLVTLSACETGITDISKSPDEYLGLPAGFLQAGAPAVISTLWAVQDVASSFLVGHFYLLHFGKDKSGQSTTPLCPASALCEAQKWLRDATAKTMDLARYFEDVYHGSGSRDVNALKLMRYYRANPNIKPFNHPYYWAGFIFSGA